ncbi:MAG: DNA helicase RecG, partial [Candidatus Omnitrophica bacterium]|nr:DNA helicase RecG [Candidatus Omnitrophota bacterium]
AAVIDEQHNFGVLQRKFLEEKAGAPHVLVMTATPIPRTLALTLYGDLDQSVMRHAPSGRGRVHTLRMESGRPSEVMALVEEEIAKGRQAYWVCPTLKTSGKGALMPAVERFRRLSERLGPGRVDVIHGQLSSDEKKGVMSRFGRGEIKLLVATTVIEVGLDVANATVMVIENAERFGLSQLHQLRGRIGRSKHESFCVLVSAAENSAAEERLTAFCELESGFDVAEEDLKFRGPGDCLGSRQHGAPQIRIGDLIRDTSILVAAREDARRLVESDPALSRPEHALLLRELKRRSERVSAQAIEAKR